MEIYFYHISAINNLNMEDFIILLILKDDATNIKQIFTKSLKFSDIQKINNKKKKKYNAIIEMKKILLKKMIIKNNAIVKYFN